MVEYKKEFIQFLENAGVLKFGDFTAKSGRKIPYFINAGDIKTGEQIKKLGEFYAKAYLDKLGKKRRSFTARLIKVFRLPCPPPLRLQTTAWIFRSSLTEKKKRITAKAACSLAIRQNPARTS